MKTAAALLLVVATVAPQSSLAKQSFLQGLPNGSAFSKSLGHSGGGFTPFGKMFSGSWSASLCKQTYPGSSITVGQAFGDPCCKWSKGATPDFAVTFTSDFPAQSTKTCAGGSSSGTTASGGGGNAGQNTGGNGGGAAKQNGGDSANTPPSSGGGEGGDSEDGEGGHKKSGKKSGGKKSSGKSKEGKKRSGGENREYSFDSIGGNSLRGNNEQSD